MLAREIELIWIASDETYGVPRMTRWLVKQGFEVNHKRVEVSDGVCKGSGSVL